MGSEFGAGVVVCLAKFSEHLANHHGERLMMLESWERATPEQRRQRTAEARRHPFGDSAQVIGAVDLAARLGGISHVIELWMNGASDHFYELDESAPPPLRELAALTLRIGHGFTQQTWGFADVKRIRELWRESCLAVDQALGVDAAWGEW